MEDSLRKIAQNLTAGVSCTAYDARVADEFAVTCPYCGEEIEIYVEPDVRGSFVQDCEVCCNPWQVTITRDRDGDVDVRVDRLD